MARSSSMKKVRNHEVLVWLKTIVGVEEFLKVVLFP